ncbi:MAG: hypothetical protein QOC63_5646 [Mycobacterium sp.]|jgi:hypothetical protein|nr:hypothetical protein [Mycobacterium sp.]
MRRLRYFTALIAAAGAAAASYLDPRDDEFYGPALIVGGDGGHGR